MAKFGGVRQRQDYIKNIPKIQEFVMEYGHLCLEDGAIGGQ